jgi:hypothetical protein
MIIRNKVSFSIPVTPINSDGNGSAARGQRAMPLYGGLQNIDTSPQPATLSLVV